MTPRENDSMEVSDSLVEELRGRFAEWSEARRPRYVLELADLHRRAATRIESLQDALEGSEQLRQLTQNTVNIYKAEMERLQEENERLREALRQIEGLDSQGWFDLGEFQLRRIASAALQQPPEQP